MKLRYATLILSCLLGACAAEIGDECQSDAECSPNYDRNCDKTQPGGYCLIIGCGPDECPEEASCVEFTPPCPTGEGYDDDPEKENCELLTANRGRTYCMKYCSKNSDCREGYTCEKVSEVTAEVIDFKHQREKICVPK